jgi:hypothetical protein
MVDQCIRICGMLMYHRRCESLPGNLQLMVLLCRTKGASVEWCRVECAKSVGMELKLDIMLSSGVRRLLHYGKR